MNILRSFSVIASLLVLGQAATASGRDPDGDPEALIMRGLELRRAGRSAEALQLFRRAYEAAPCPRTLGQMGLVESSLQRWSDADVHLTAALATPDDGWVHKNRVFLEQAMDRTREHVGELVITGPPGARIALQGRAIGALPLLAPIRLAEGEVAVNATSDGSKPYTVDVSIKGGARAAISIVLEPLDLGLPDPRSETTTLVSARSPKRTRLGLGASLAVTGVAALVWGIMWITIDGRPSCGGCATSYDTKTPGLLLVGGGSALALAGGALIISALHLGDPAKATIGVANRSVQFEAHF
jgi:hypothetical protein